MKSTLKKLLPGIIENVSLKKYSTFKIGGKAKYFFAPEKKEDFIKAIITATDLKLPFFVLGNGSNLLISDEGFKGLVVKVQMTKLKCQNNTICAESGAPLPLLVSQSVKNSLTGLEWAVGIPGTLGGAIYGNAGAFGQSMSDSIKKVEVLDTKDLKFKIYNLEKCEFGYRDSIFKKNKNLIIISAKLKLKKDAKQKITEKIKEYLMHRVKAQPLNFPSIGSIFKNPKEHFAAELIEKCVLKGKRMGDVKVSEKHANFIVNLREGNAGDVVKLIKLIKKEVHKKYKIKLEEEIQYLGF